MLIVQIIVFQGVPLRLEIGPKDLERGQLIAVRRDNGEKLSIPLEKDPVNGYDKLVKRITELLDQIQQDMLTKAELELKQNVKLCRKWSECASHLASKHLLLIPFCGRPSCEDNIKRDTAKYITFIDLKIDIQNILFVTKCIY